MVASVLGRLTGARARLLPPPASGGAMRVLLVSYEYPPLGGGGAKVVRGLAAELVRAGHQVDVITTGWGALPAESSDEGVRVTRLRTLRMREDRSTVLELGVWVVRALPAVLRRLANERYDAINAHFILPDGLICALACTLFGKGFVVTAHGSDVPGYNGDRFQLAHRLLNRVWRQLVRSPACIVFPSEHLLKLARRQDVPFKACVIPNGFDAGLRSAK
ncbi:MAG: glycosyltransferase family 4 protein, partial [Geminicoccaceae bacterium]|nr:glycosyltransferase family 4 protein [Geminicoccaceae bacterium]